MKEKAEVVSPGFASHGLMITCLPPGSAHKEGKMGLTEARLGNRSAAGWS